MCPVHASNLRISGGGVTKAFVIAGAALLAVALAGCAGRPSGNLVVVPASAPGASAVDMMVATTRIGRSGRARRDVQRRARARARLRRHRRLHSARRNAKDRRHAVAVDDSRRSRARFRHPARRPARSRTRPRRRSTSACAPARPGMSCCSCTATTRASRRRSIASRRSPTIPARRRPAGAVHLAVARQSCSTTSTIARARPIRATGSKRFCRRWSKDPNVELDLDSRPFDGQFRRRRSAAPDGDPRSQAVAQDQGHHARRARSRLRRVSSRDRRDRGLRQGPAGHAVRLAGR